MRNLLLAGLAGILLAGPALADPRDDYRGGPRGDYRQDQRRDYRNDRRDWQGDRQAFRGDSRHDARDWRDDRNYYRYDRDRRDVRWNGNRYRGPIYSYPPGYRYQAWGVGYRLPPAYFGNRYWIANPGGYRLPPAYRGTRWVRVGPDALLINIVDGLIVQAVRGLY